MLDSYDYVNNDKDAKAAAYPYDTYIGAEMNFPDADGDSLYRRVKKKFGTIMAKMQATLIVTHCLIKVNTR